MQIQFPNIYIWYSIFGQILLFVTTLIRTVTGLDFMAHVEERLMAAQDTDTEVQRDTIREMEQVFAYGEKSSFR